MTTSENESNPNPLAGFLLGPAWARGGDSASSTPARTHQPAARREEAPRRGERFRDRDDRKDRGGRDTRDGGGRGERKSGGGFRGRDRHSGPPVEREVFPEPGVRVTLVPDRQAVQLIAKEVHQVARVYSLFDVAQILLAERARCRARFEAAPNHSPMFLGKLDESLFLTREEALRHLWKPELVTQILDVETIECDPPAGRYNAVARCGFSGVWLGPPNHHSYQTNLRRLHRDCFAHIPFDAYAAKVRTEQGEEAVNAWLETMKTRQHWRIKGDGDDSWIEDKATAEQAVAARAFGNAFAETHSAEISAGVAPGNLSPGLFAGLRQSGSHVKRNPAVLIPSVCAVLESQHLPVFKRSGKLYTGPSRPHPLPEGVPLAERPERIVSWIKANQPAKLAGLWQAVHPTGGSEPCIEYVNDLFWLLNQGHVLLFSDDSLALAGSREPENQPQQKKSGEPKPPKKGKRDRRPKSGDARPPAEGASFELAIVETVAFQIEFPPVPGTAAEPAPESGPEA